MARWGRWNTQTRIEPAAGSRQRRAAAAVCAWPASGASPTGRTRLLLGEVSRGRGATASRCRVGGALLLGEAAGYLLERRMRLAFLERAAGRRSPAAAAPPLHPWTCVRPLQVARSAHQASSRALLARPAAKRRSPAQTRTAHSPAPLPTRPPPGCASPTRKRRPSTRQRPSAPPSRPSLSSSPSGRPSTWCLPRTFREPSENLTARRPACHARWPRPLATPVATPARQMAASLPGPPRATPLHSHPAAQPPRCTATPMPRSPSDPRRRLPDRDLPAGTGRFPAHDGPASPLPRRLHAAVGPHCALAGRPHARPAARPRPLRPRGATP